MRNVQGLFFNEPEQHGNFLTCIIVPLRRQLHKNFPDTYWVKEKE